MDVIASPFVTAILNIVATALIAHGILDIKYKDTFIQLGNTMFAGLITAMVSIYSIYKMVDLHKHAISNTPASPVAPTQPTVGDISQKRQPVFTAPGTQQTGLPKQS